MIRDMLSLTDQPDRSCDGVADIARAQLNHVSQRIAHLTRLKIELERMIDICRGGRVAQCRIVEALTDISGTV